METITTSHRHYTDLEREELIEQWKQSGKNKLAFCKEREIGYFSFNSWIKGKKKKAMKVKSGFVSVKVKNQGENISAKFILKSGTIVNVYQALDADFISALLKA